VQQHPLASVTIDEALAKVSAVTPNLLSKLLPN
jgi:hypothetical protein